jgi:holo-[acyl-carrier protein] synthase
MAIVGLGTDLVDTARFRRYLEEKKIALLERLFTAGERSYALNKPSPAQHLAARFAAKEACLKAFGTGLRDGLRWVDIEVVADERGRPGLSLSGRAAELAGNLGVQTTHLSYAHDGGYAFATVVLETS